MIRESEALRIYLTTTNCDKSIMEIQRVTRSNRSTVIGLTSMALVLMVLSISTKETAAFFNMVETGVSEIAPEGRHVAVNIPAIFSMTLDTRGVNAQNQSMGARMSQRVLLGLVGVELDVKRGDDNRMHGPVKVTVAGLPVYNNNAEVPAV